MILPAGPLVLAPLGTPGDRGWALLPSNYPTIGHESVVPLGMGAFLLTGTNDLKAIYDPRASMGWCSIKDSGMHQALFASISLDRRTAVAVDDYCPLPMPPLGGCTPAENGRLYWIPLGPLSEPAAVLEDQVFDL